MDKEKRKYIKQQFEKEFKKEMKGRGYKFRNGCAFIVAQLSRQKSEIFIMN